MKASEWSQYCAKLVNTRAYQQYQIANVERLAERHKVLLPAMLQVEAGQERTLQALLEKLAGHAGLLQALTEAAAELENRRLGTLVLVPSGSTEYEGASDLAFWGIEALESDNADIGLFRESEWARERKRKRQEKTNSKMDE